MQHWWVFEITGWFAIVMLPVFALVPCFAWHYRRRNTKADYRPDWSFSGPLEFVIWSVATVAVLAYVTIADKIRFDSTSELASNQKPLKVQEVGLNWKHPEPVSWDDVKRLQPRAS